MNKDKEWLRDELMKFKESTSGGYEDVIGVSHVLRIIDQLDEPEKLSQEWIEKHRYHDGDLDAYFIRAESLENLIVAEPKKVVIPQFVADWLKLRKKEFKSITKAVYFLWSYGWDNKTHIDYKMAIWMERNGDAFARAWLDYPNIEVEKEPLYYVKFVGDNEMTYLNQSNGTSYFFISFETSLFDNKTQFTEKEIKDFDERYWQFAIPVEEEEK